MLKLSQRIADAAAAGMSERQIARRFHVPISDVREVLSAQKSIISWNEEIETAKAILKKQQLILSGTDALDSIRKHSAANGGRLRMERKQLHLTQAYLAEAIGVSRQFISLYERGLALRRPALDFESRLFYSPCGIDATYVLSGRRLEAIS